MQQVRGGSSPIPVVYAMKMTLPALMTLDATKQDLSNVINRVKSRTQRKVSESVFGVSGNVSVDFL